MCTDQEIIYKGKLVRVGEFHERPENPRFRDSGPMKHNLVVFPRTSVRITYAGKESIVTDPNVVMFYNTGQEYTRGEISERGDCCEWFLFDNHVLLEAIKVHNPDVEDHAEKPFQWTHGASDPVSYLQQRLVVQHIHSRAHPDALFIEESLLAVLDRVLENAYTAREGKVNRKQRNASAVHKEVTDAVKTILATRFRQRLSLDEIAQEINYSPYHLCRVFRKQTGLTIHRYLNQIRLRTSLEYIAQEETDLTRLALNLGYSSHSHFTQAFRRTFGAPPSELRRDKTAHNLSKLRKILIA